MNYRKFEIYPTTDPGASGTKTIDLNVKDAISRIEVKFGAINGDYGVDDHPAANLVRIEVVDGSDVLYSLTGKCGQAVAFYDGVEGLHNSASPANGAFQECVVPINFGRFLRDPLLALDPTKFVNPQLKITWNRALANTSSATGYLTVYLYMFDERIPALIGFLENSEHYSYSPSANAYETLELPRDLVLRRFAVQMHEYGQGYGGLYNEVRLDEDFLKRIPILEGLGDMQQRHRLDYPLVVDKYDAIVLGAAQDLYLTPSGWPQIHAVPTSGYEDLRMDDSGGGKVSVIIEGEVTSYMRFAVEGLFPHTVFDFPLGDQMEIDDWFDVTKLQSARLRIRAGAGADGSETYRVLVQQLRRY